MRALFMTLALMALPFTAIAQSDTDISTLPPGVYTMDPTHASLTWKVDHLGLAKYTARFTKFEAAIMLDPENIEKSEVKATIDPTSIRTDYPNADEKDFDKELSEKKEWFNTTQFPTIEFRSISVEKTGDKTGKITGNLTFLGTTKPVVLDVTLNGVMGNHPFANQPAIGFSATGSIKRSEFGMTNYIPNVGDNVDIIIEAEFIKGE